MVKIAARLWRARNAVVAATLLAVVTSAAIVTRIWPKSPLSAALPSSTAVSAQGGQLLRLTLAADGRYRLWVPLESMPPRLSAAVILYEDRWFYRHPGVNPVALLKAAFNGALGKRPMGASTLTMQLARRLHAIDTRTVIGKFRQMAYAVWLEGRYSKHDILEAYLNLAPYGRNVEGAGAASLVFFGTRVGDLSVPRIMSLAVVPQNPRARRLYASPQPNTSQDAGVDNALQSTRDPGKARATALDDARGRLWARWLKTHPTDERFSSEVAVPALADRTEPLPFLAPHFTDAVLHGATGDVHTTLELSRQMTVERVMHTYIQQHADIGIHNAGALLLEVVGGSAKIRAYAGSADYWNSGIDGQVNAVTAKRSPGSTLKPFVYALALDQGLLHPRTILKDAPASFGPFSPENFDGRFVGPIAAEEALVRSRNVPAVEIASHLSHPDLYDFLRAANVSRLKSERHYGLALTLGGGDVSMEELGRMYAIFLDDGRLPALQYLISPAGAVPGLASHAAPSADAIAPLSDQLLSTEAAFITLDMLEKNPRPDTGQPASPSIAWKTGTSWGFHDAWSVAVFGRYVLVVWIGNFDNTGNPAFVGVQAAAPLLFRIIDALRSEGLAPDELPRPRPANLARVAVCAASGDLPNADCPQTVMTWYIPGKSPIRISNLHRPVYLDLAGHRVCGPGAGIHSEIYEFWSSDMLQLFRDAGMPRRVPPPAPACGSSSPSVDDRDAPQIISPLRGVTYALRTGHLDPLALRANTASRAQATYWFADNAYLGRVPAGESLPWLPPRPGHYELRAIDDSGAEGTREVDVESIP